jgi:amino acid transporter
VSGLDDSSGWKNIPNNALTLKRVQWAPDLHPAILISVLVPLYFALNIWNVSFFGEAEFWLAIGKVLLIFILLFYTFITMLGGNPLGDRYGFRWVMLSGKPLARSGKGGDVDMFNMDAQVLA